MVIHFFCKIQSYRKRRTSHGDFQLDVVHNWPYKLPQKSIDEKSSPSVTQVRILSFKSHKMALAALRS
jgi:hypothetical protein